MHFNFHLLLLYFYMDLYSVCVHVVFLSRRSCLYIYTIVCILVQLIHVHVHNSILLFSPFLRLSRLSLFPFLSLMLVCYTHIFHVHVHVLQSFTHKTATISVLGYNRYMYVNVHICMYMYMYIMTAQQLQHPRWGLLPTLDWDTRVSPSV